MVGFKTISLNRWIGENDPILIVLGNVLEAYN